MDSWTKDLHRLWTKRRSTDCGRSCPPTAHRLRPVVPSDRRLLHMPVHCSASQRASSPCRVKGVTRSCLVGLWVRRVNLGTPLGRTAPGLCTVCAELSVLHRYPRLSTASAHRPGGQNLPSELRKRGYPRFPQPLLLLPTRESWESVSKWVLCTTRSGLPDRASSRLDPERLRVSVVCVRLFPVSFPSQEPATPRQTTKPGRARSAGNSRRRQQ